ncbi:MAG TPA: anti-sigma factor [Caldimonas sp.]|jgi:anti-sigma factor RsiW|nr:anti-sigma factor [Caldimonas sp.]HEX4234030.1 anti-sigma factor [Caldimonas sp.]
MNTAATSWKIDAFVDGELDLAGQLEIEERMQQDESLRSRIESLRALRETVRDKAERHAAPAALRERMTTMLDAARRESSAPAATAPRRSTLAQTLGRWLAWRPLVAATAFVALLSVALNVTLQAWNQERLMDEAVASHARSTLGQHLVDVASSDHHTVKPFLSARLGFSPPVRELPLPGSVFLGGRVDYLDGRPVAALVYRQGEHIVNSFIWPDTGGDSKPVLASERGFLVAHWVQGGMRHCVISDVNRDEFHRLVEAVRSVSAAG